MPGTKIKSVLECAYHDIKTYDCSYKNGPIYCGKKSFEIPDRCPLKQLNVQREKSRSMLKGVRDNEKKRQVTKEEIIINQKKAVSRAKKQIYIELPVSSSFTGLYRVIQRVEGGLRA